MARRDDREYREYLREEQRSQPGCPAREVVLDQPIQATRSARHGRPEGLHYSDFFTGSKGFPLHERVVAR
jgi:hypothetical protein